MFQLSPGEIHHSTARRENAGDLSAGWTLLWVQATQPSWGASSACTDNTTLCSLWRGNPVASLAKSSLYPQWSKATSHPPVPLPLLLGSLRQGTKKGLSLSLALTVLQNQCRGTWVGLRELAWLLLEDYTYTVNKRKSSTQQLYISTKFMKE